MCIYIYNQKYHNRTSMIFTTNSDGFRTLQGAVSTATITYNISSRGRLENIWRYWFGLHKSRFFQGTFICIQFKDSSIFPKQICYMDTLEKKPGPYDSPCTCPYSLRNLVNTCCPQIGAVRADIPSIFNRAEGSNKTSFVRWSNNTSASFSSFDIVSMWALIENPRFVGTVIKALARTLDVQNVFDWSGKDRSLMVLAFEVLQAFPNSKL